MNEHAKICSEHFLISDFIKPYATYRRLKSDVIPSIFRWNKDKVEHRRAETVIEKLNRSRIEEEEETDTASEGEGDMAVGPRSNPQVSRKTQTFDDDFCTDDLGGTFRKLPCSHQFLVRHLLSKCTTPSKEKKLFTHFTGFNSHDGFKSSLHFVLPGLDRKLLTYWDTAAGKSRMIDTEKLFGSDHEKTVEFDDNNHDKSTTRLASHKFPLEDEYFLVLMQLRMGLSNIDLSERFCTTESVVNNILLTWINYLYITLGSLKIWPHRDVILDNAPAEFLEKYTNNVVIIDATELKIQVPSALQKHSESYSTYKSHTTLKCLLGVDPKGGDMFVSQLYEGSISDKQIVKRSGF